ncbi:hypothetical protein P4B35_04990 [Pontiellaceae bacterium B12227]|nr:hypothetical protein [Pontiellaceae bacterium B12227]
MKTALIISGWAHGIEAIRPIGDALADRFDVQLLTGTQVLKEQTIPDADYIITGSMGGLLAMELLPASCKKLVLISSTAKFCAGENYACGTHEKILKRMILMLKRNPEAVLADFYKNVHYPNPALKTDPECGLNDLVDGLEYLLESDVRAKVPTLGIPVHLFHGSEDRIIPLAAAEWLHDNLPDSRLTVFEDGHGLAAHHFKPMMSDIFKFAAR